MYAQNLEYPIPRNLSSMTTLLDHKTTLAYLAYLGFPDEQRTSALHTTRPRKVDRRKGKVTRNVFLCYVCGAAGSGKTSLLCAFAGKSFREAYEPTSKMFSVVNAVDIDGSEKYLVVGIVPCGMVWTFDRVLCSCRNLGQNTRPKPYGRRRRWTSPISSSMSMTRVIPIHSRTSVIYGYVTCVSTC